jgi:succinoglycan biosynthesis transport protein ExoP
MFSQMNEKAPVTFDLITKKMALRLRRAGVRSLCGTEKSQNANASFLSYLASTRSAPRRKAAHSSSSGELRGEVKQMRKDYDLLPPINHRLQRTFEAAPLSRAERLTPGASGENSALDVFGLLRPLFRRRTWIYACTAAALGMAVLVCLIMTPEYSATSRVQLLNQEQGRLSLRDGNEGSAGFDFYSTLQTYVTVMQSDTLALQVIKELHLENSPGLRYSPLIMTDGKRRQIALPLDLAPLKRTAILKIFRAKLIVDAVPGTRLITVSYKDANPEITAKVVNQLVRDFIDYNFKVRYNATTKATDFLSRQLVDLKAEVEQSQERAVELQKASGILGTDEHNNIIVTRLEQLNTELTAAQSSRIVKEAVYNLARNGDPELIAGLLGTTSSSTGSTSQASSSLIQASNSLSLINHLREQEADLNAQFADLSAKYGPAYPRLIELKDRLASLRSSIDAELGKVSDTAKSEYELAVSREAAARKLFEEQKKIASTMNNKAIDYTIAKHEAESNRVLYDNLQQKIKEADVLAGLRSSELNVIDPAVVPGRPDKPRIPLYLAVGTFAGLALGVVAAFVLEAMDRTVRNPQEIESANQIPVLGVIPQAKIFPGIQPRDWLKAYGPYDRNGLRNTIAGLLGPDNWAVAEAFRWLRTSLLLSRAEEPPKVLMVASAMAGEGKSFSSLNLAAALAQNGSRVLLVDADLRRGTLSRVLGQHSSVGLSELLLGTADRQVYRPIEEVPGLIFVPGGDLLSCPSELLGSERMADLIHTWREQFNYVVLDTPALLPVTDSVVLSPHADIVIMVARFAYSQSESIARAVRLMKGVQVNSIGVLVNAMDPRSPEYSRYCGSYGYEEYQGDDPHPLPPSRRTPKGEGS